MPSQISWHVHIHITRICSTIYIHIYIYIYKAGWEEPPLCCCTRDAYTGKEADVVSDQLSCTSIYNTYMQYHIYTYIHIYIYEQLAPRSLRRQISSRTSCQVHLYRTRICSTIYIHIYIYIYKAGSENPPLCCCARDAYTGRRQISSRTSCHVHPYITRICSTIYIHIYIYIYKAGSERAPALLLYQRRLHRKETDFVTD